MGEVIKRYTFCDFCNPQESQDFAYGDGWLAEPLIIALKDFGWETIHESRGESGKVACKKCSMAIKK